MSRIQLCGIFRGIKASSYKLSCYMAVYIYAAYDDIFNFFFYIVIQLISFSVEKLYPVVFKCVVGSAYYDPRIGLIIFCQIGYGRSRYDSRSYDISSDRQYPGSKSAFKHISGNSCIFSDNYHRALIIFFEHMSPCFPQIKSQFRRQFLVGHSPYAISSEQSSHHFPPEIILS